MAVKLYVIVVLMISLWDVAGTWIEFEGYEYLINYQIVESYEEAESNCAANRSHLVNVKTTVIHDFLKGNLSKPQLSGFPYSFYIGARREKVGGQFKWTDETIVNVPQWNNETSEPNDDHELCVIMGNHDNNEDLNYNWRDVRCDHTSRFICQRHLVPATTTTRTDAKSTVPTSTQVTSSTVQETAHRDDTNHFEAISSATTTLGDKASTKNTTVPVSSTRHQTTSLDGQAENQATDPIPVVVGSVCGSVIFVFGIVLTVLYFRHRRSADTNTAIDDRRQNNAYEDHETVENEAYIFADKDEVPADVKTPQTPTQHPAGEEGVYEEATSNPENTYNTIPEQKSDDAYEVLKLGN